MDTQTPHTPGKQRPHRLSTYLRGIVYLAAVLACAPCSAYASETPSDAIIRGLLRALGIGSAYASEIPSDARELRTQFGIGLNTFNGMGVEKDEEKGAALIRDAVDKGVGKVLEETRESGAMMYLGRCYYEGIGVEKDATKAVEWFRKAAELGDGEAMEYLAKCYRDGTGVEKDITKAVEWYCKEADKGFLSVIHEVIRIAPEKAVQYYRKCAEAGNDEAMYELGKCYLEGIGVEKDAAQAKQWLRKAADKNYNPAKALLQQLEQK